MRPPQLATFVMSWQSRRFSVVCSTVLLEEYERVLSYPDVQILIFLELLRAFRDHLQHDPEMVSLPYIPATCRDLEDDKVIATAVFGMADYLLSEDKDLFAPEVVRVLAESGIRLLNVQDFIARLDSLEL
jgi:putative PIN family toxin of toxin-antitoxin system